jgi:hypothetical protein
LFSTLNVLLSSLVEVIGNEFFRSSNEIVVSHIIHFVLLSSVCLVFAIVILQSTVFFHVLISCLPFHFVLTRVLSPQSTLLRHVQHHKLYIILYLYPL